MLNYYMFEGLKHMAQWLFDVALIAFVWTPNTVNLAMVDAWWIENFGVYANTVKISFQVLFTILVALTGFFRLLREISKYRKEKNDRKKE